MKFKGKVIAITGGSSGIGLATAKLFAKEGAIVYSLDIASFPVYSDNNIHSIQCDVSKISEIETAISHIIKNNTSIDYLFANAGIHLISSIEESTLADVEKVISINLKGTFYTLKVILPFMKKQGHGSIVLMGSDQSFVGKRDNAIYGATKAAIAQLTKSTALDYSEYNIRVNCVCPGTIDTPLTQNAVSIRSRQRDIKKEIIYDSLRKAQPLQRLGTPDEVAKAVAFLCSNESSFITGTLLSIDGGFTAQ